ncbi:MAG TPA: hypothetical protein VH500_12935 [Nitrososphaeraceae archaeon]
MLKVDPGDILLDFGGLVLGLGVTHTYFSFSSIKLAHQGLGPTDISTRRSEGAIP